MNRVLALIGAIPFLAPAHAEEGCPVEIKLLLSPSTTETVIASLGFEKATTGQVYLFDTDALDLLKQGVIMRVRQGAKNDLTVKVRFPEDSRQFDKSRFRGRFPCEIDRTRGGASTSYAVARNYKSTQVPESGESIYSRLNASQIQLLHDAQVSIDWARVRRIADINSTTWQTAARSPSGKLTLEGWQWPAGKILELSAKAGSDAEASKYAQLERLVKMKNLSLSVSQDTKTSLVLETMANQASPLR